MNRTRHYILLVGIVAGCLAPPAAGVETFLSTREAVLRMIPSATRYSVAKLTPTDEEVEFARSEHHVTLPQREYNMFFGWDGSGALVGAMLMDSERGKHGPVKLAVGLTPEDGTVRDLAVMQYQEVRGRPVREDAYLNQYHGKGAEDPIQLGDDIRGLTGASYSSRAVTAVVKRAVVIFHVLYLRRGGADSLAGTGE